MIFTIGSKEVYTQQIKKAGKIMKRGRDPSYIGGYAFLTKEDAQKRIDSTYPDHGFIVFGLDAVWGLHTEQSDYGDFHHLLVDRPIILIHQIEEEDFLPPQYICLTCKTVIGPVWDDEENQCSCDVYEFEVVLMVLAATSCKCGGLS